MLERGPIEGLRSGMSGWLNQLISSDANCKYSDHKGDILTEMRFYVPNNELDMVMEQRE